MQDADGDTALHGAAESGNIEIINLLLTKGADIELKNKAGGTPLMWAAVYGNEQAVRTLIGHGANPNVKDVDGMSALDWAVKNKRTRVAEILKTQAGRKA